MLRPIKVDEDPMTIDLDVCDFYVRVSGLPISGAHKGVSMIVGNALGVFVSLDEEFNKGGLATTMRLRVCMNFTKPLLRCVTIQGPKKYSP